MHRLKQLYHFVLPFIGAFLYRFPSRKVLVIGVTGTKGKSSTTELVDAILEAAGHKTAVLNSIRIKLGEDTRPNTMRMSMPGRLFIQRFLYRAVNSGCTAVVLEMTSQGALQYRHRAIDMDALIFMNLAPEHIEAHGSYKSYADAKFEIAKQLTRSKKRPRIMVFNSDDAQAPQYAEVPVEKVVPFSLKENEDFKSDNNGGYFDFNGVRINMLLPGDFSLYNGLAAAECMHALGVETPTIARALQSVDRIPGRAELVDEGQAFPVVIDYAHTPESLQAIYDTYKGHYRICVLGATGGGRDAWKRPVMGGIAEAACDTVILTNEDPYDEDPLLIIEGVKSGMKREPIIIMDRRKAIAHALATALGFSSVASPAKEAQNKQHPPPKPTAVLITGKGTDPNIYGPKGSKMPWSDARVVREELKKLL